VLFKYVSLRVQLKQAAKPFNRMTALGVVEQARPVCMYVCTSWYRIRRLRARCRKRSSALGKCRLGVLMINAHIMQISYHLIDVESICMVVGPWG